MGKDTPRYFVTLKGRHYWQPSSELRRAGWSARSLGNDRVAALSKAIALNAEVDQWYAAGRPARGHRGAEAWSSGARTSADARRSRPGSCDALFDLYQADRDYPTNKNTKRQYDGAIAYLRKWIGPVPANKVTPRMAKQRYDAMAERTPAMAAGIMRVARAAFGRARFLVDPGHPLYIGVHDNPFLELDLKGTQSEGRIWTAEERDAMVRAAMHSNIAHYPSIALAIELNWWLGQREGDILELAKDALEGQSLVIRQNKTARRVELPVAILPRIHDVWAHALEHQRTLKIESLTHLLVNERTGNPWDEHAFRKAFREVRSAAGGDVELQFMHLRHTAVVEMEDAGATIPEIASVTGHSLQSVTQILERYGRRTRRQAENAIRKRMADKEKSRDGGTS